MQRFPNRMKVFEVAKVNDPTLIQPEIAIANLKENDSFILSGYFWKVKKVSAKTITFDVEGKTKRIRVDSRDWEQFVREVDGMIFGYIHGAQEGKALYEAMVRDPAMNAGDFPIAKRLF